MEEIIDRANNVKYGLATGVITNHINKAMYFANTVDAGSVWINCYDAVLPQTPFGGYKQCGMGRICLDWRFKKAAGLTLK